MPTLSPSPTITSTLAQKISTATQQKHKALNQAIVTLLPHALPPHVQDAQLYASGMAHILPIYTAFEDSFKKILTLPPPLRSASVEIIAMLHVPALERTTRLQGDLSLLSPSNPSEKAVAYDLPPRLTAFLTHIKTTTTTRPHLLLAYTHTFYLALFSGGRYIRAKLRAAGCSDNVLTFWTFDSPSDGEDLKMDFKARFAEVESALSEEQIGEVVQDAEFIMDTMMTVVEEIVDTVGVGEGEKVGQKEVGSWKSRLGNRERPVKQPQMEARWSLPVGKGLQAQQERDLSVSVRWMVLKHMLPMGLVELISGGMDLLGFGCWEWRRLPLETRVDKEDIDG